MTSFKSLAWKVLGVSSVLTFLVSIGALSFFCRSDILTGGETRCLPKWLDDIGSPALLILVVISGIACAGLLYRQTEEPLSPEPPRESSRKRDDN